MVEPVLDFTLARDLPQVWRIENLELAPVDSKWLGHFFGGDCYLLLYTYLIGEKKHYLLYIWQVRPAHPVQSTASSVPAPLYPCQVAILFDLNSCGDGELTPFSSWDCFGCEIPMTLSTPIHNPFPFWFSEPAFPFQWPPLLSLHLL